MDNRIWQTLEDSWCVDCALSYPQRSPNATITVSSASGVPTLTAPVLVYGGSDYGADTYAQIDDPTGSGAILTLVLVGGVITNVVLSGTITGYTSPTVRVIDPSRAGRNGAITINVQYLTTVFASPGVFANSSGSGAAGDVIRMDGRTMQVTAFGTSTSLTANVIRNYGQVITDDLHKTPVPVASGNWTIAAPATVLHGLDHLEGMAVSALADGVIVAPQVVTGGSITLPQPATKIVAGLGFTAQLQTLYLDVPGSITVQGRRKELDQAIIRVANSAMPFEAGANQVDASTTPTEGAVTWVNMTQAATPIDPATPMQPFSLFTGDVVAPLIDELGGDRGQIAIQQSSPVPLSVLAVMPWSRIQDDANV